MLGMARINMTASCSREVLVCLTNLNPPLPILNLSPTSLVRLHPNGFQWKNHWDFYYSGWTNLHLKTRVQKGSLLTLSPESGLCSQMR